MICNLYTYRISPKYNETNKIRIKSIKIYYHYNHPINKGIFEK
jgi:hypothetical protein